MFSILTIKFVLLQLTCSSMRPSCELHVQSLQRPARLAACMLSVLNKAEWAPDIPSTAQFEASSTCVSPEGSQLAEAHSCAQYPVKGKTLHVAPLPYSHSYKCIPSVEPEYAAASLALWSMHRHCAACVLSRKLRDDRQHQCQLEPYSGLHGPLLPLSLLFQAASATG